MALNDRPWAFGATISRIASCSAPCARRNAATAALASQSITVARARTTAALLIRTEETSNYANVDAAFRPIADKAEAREAEQHHCPG